MSKEIEDRLNSLPDDVVELYRKFDDPIVYKCVNYFLSNPSVSRDKCIGVIVKSLSESVSEYKKIILDNAMKQGIPMIHKDSIEERGG